MSDESLSHNAPSDVPKVDIPQSALSESRTSGGHWPPYTFAVPQRTFRYDENGVRILGPHPAW